jgi:hypothetical protein
MIAIRAGPLEGDRVISQAEILADIAAWSTWMPFARAVDRAPRRPGVYLARQGPDGALIYVGKAGERRGWGIRGRLAVYSRGQAAVSGLGEAAFDRALADREWLLRRLAEVDAGHPRRVTAWAREAIRWADVYLCWFVTEDEASAAELERRVLTILHGHPLWNRRGGADGEQPPEQHY